MNMKPYAAEDTEIEQDIITRSSNSVLLDRGVEFKFNDHVCIECLLGVPIENRAGRLVQVRLGCGQFGSNVYVVRLADGRLVTFENVLIRRVDDVQFEDAFYIRNGQRAPVIPAQEPYPGDSEEETYYIANEWPEQGFIVHNPRQPNTPGCFTVTMTDSKSQKTRVIEQHV